MAEFIVEGSSAGARLDAFVSGVAGVSRTVVQRLISEGAVTVNGARAQKSLRMEEGMRVEVILEAPPDLPQPEMINVPVVYSDEHLVVVAKPAGLVVHPAPGHAAGTLVNALLASADDAPVGGDDDDRPGIVHRLDASTSGLMIVAKSDQAHARLVEMMSAHEVAPIGRSPQHRKKMAVVAGGKSAITHVAVIERLAGTTLLEARLETGRTHQIRVHLAAIDHPVVGDQIYGRSRALARELGLERPFLHSARLGFAHPVTGAPLAFEEPLPADLVAALAKAR